MPGPACTFCGKDWVQGCWTAEEALTCGNLDRNAIRGAKTLAAAMNKAERVRKQTADDIEKFERRELARLKRKYET